MAGSKSAKDRKGPDVSMSTGVTADEATWVLRDVLRGNSAVNVALGRQLGLSTTDLAAMEHLLEGDRDLGPVELGHRLGIRSASATALVDRLETAGHLERKPHASDRRRRTLEVTPTALKSVMAALGPIIGDLNAVAESLSTTERAAVTRYLRAIAEVLNAHSE
jgi:DNA-binding MarR family transcriptional regulator